MQADLTGPETVLANPELRVAVTRPVHRQAGTVAIFRVVTTCSTSYTVVMAKRNLTIQLDEATIRHAKIVAAHRGLSLSSLVAQQLNELAAAGPSDTNEPGPWRREHSPTLPAAGHPDWHREELHDL